MAYIPASNNFANAFNLTLHQSMAQAERDAERKRQEDSWNKFATSFVPQQPTEQTQVQVPTSPIPGQSGITTQPSESVIPPTTQTQTINTPSKDPYKQLEFETGKQFAEQLRAMSGMNPAERQMAMRNLWDTREKTLSDARFEKFTTDLNDLMAGMNPADPVSFHTTRAKAITLGKKAGIDAGTVLKMFEQDKPVAVAAGTTLLDPRTMKPLYVSPEKPMNDYQAQRLDLERQRLRQYQDKPNQVDEREAGFRERMVRSFEGRYKSVKPVWDAEKNEMVTPSMKDDPEYQQYMEDKQWLDSYRRKGNKTSPATNSGYGPDIAPADAAVGTWINAAMAAGHTADEVKSALEKKGYGTRYHSWVPSGK